MYIYNSSPHFRGQTLDAERPPPPTLAGQPE